MKFISIFSILLLICFFAISDVIAADRESADELYVKSGLEKQMQGIGPALLAGYQNNYRNSKKHTARDEKIYQNIGKVIESSFDTQVMRETVLNGIVENISENDMNVILAWLSSSVGKKITELEEMAGSKKGMDETQKFIRNIKKTSITKKRIRLIKELNAAMNITATTVDITLSTQFALSMTTKQAKGKLSRDSILKLYEDFKKDMVQIEPMVEHQVHGSLLYTYQPLADEELEQFVAFVKSKSGKNYTSVTSSFLTQAIIEGSLQFASDISQF